MEDNSEEKTVQIKIQSSGGELTFKVKKSTPFSKIFKAFADKNGVPTGTHKFTFDGQTIKDSDTPESLQVEDGDSIGTFILI